MNSRHDACAVAGTLSAAAYKLLTPRYDGCPWECGMPKSYFDR